MLYETSKIVFSRLIFTIFDIGIQGVTRFTGGYNGLHGVRRGYKGLQELTGGYKELKGVTRGEKALQGVTKDYRKFILNRTFPDTFSWSIFIKIKVEEISNPDQNDGLPPKEKF